MGALLGVAICALVVLLLFKSQTPNQSKTMKCESCNGTGTSRLDDTKKCFLCDGTGSMCDICGEACDDAGMQTCDACAEEACE